MAEIARPSASKSAPRFLLPNLAAMLGAATLFYCLFLFGAGENLFRDGDTGWHIRNGEQILSQHALPRTDPFSFSKAGQPWVAWEWGADVVMAVAYRTGGLPAITAAFAIMIAIASWMWCKLSFAAHGDFLLAGLLAPLAITTMSPHWLARPHIFSWLFLLAALLVAERAPSRLRAWHLLAAAAMMAVWANLHGSFVLGPLIAIVFATSHWLRPLIWPLDPAVERGRAHWYGWMSIAALAGSLLNPYGWNLHAHILNYLWSDGVTSQVAEFQSFNFHDAEAIPMALTMAIAAVGGVLALGQKKIAHFLLAAMFVWGGLRSARVLPLVALLILPLANGAIARAVRRARGLQPRLRGAIDSALNYSARLQEIDLRLSGWAFSAVALAACLLLMQTPAYSRHIGFPAGAFPVKAGSALETLPATARILAPDSYGGYLIYRFNGERKVFFDGRSDFYGATFLKEYSTLIGARPGWQAIVSQYAFTHALLPNHSALTSALTQSGWKTLYRDGDATLLEAR